MALRPIGLSVLPARPLEGEASVIGSVEALAHSRERSCFRAHRGALAIDAFRCVVGLALCVHFGKQLLESSALLEARMIMSANGSTWIERALGIGVPAASIFGVACVLALSIAAGSYPKACAALLLPISVSLQHTLASVARLDDWIANVALCWMLLLPIGASLVPETDLRSAWLRWRSTRVSGIAASVLACHVLAFYPWVHGLRMLSPAWQEPPGLVLALCGLPALYLLPLGRMRVLGPILQVALHAYLAAITGEWLAHSVLAGSSFVLWGETEPPEAPVTPQAFRSSDALAVAYSALIAITVIGAWLPTAQAGARARKALSDSGLAPIATGIRPVRQEPLFVDDRGVARAWSAFAQLPRADEVRTQLFFAQLMARGRTSRSMSRAALDRADRMLRAIATRYCAIDAEASRTDLAFANSSSAGLTPIARFDCSQAAPAASAAFLSSSHAALGDSR